MSFIAMALALTVLDAAPSPLPLFELGAMPEGGYRAFLTVAPDGRWTATGNRSGELTPDQLREVESGIANTSFTTIKETRRCTTPSVLQLVRVQRGEVRFTTECGPQPDPSITRLIQLVQRFTTDKQPARPEASPMIVKVEQWRDGEELRKQAIILMRSGMFTTDNGVGNTGGQELADLLSEFTDAELSATPAADGCRSTLHLTVEVPARGRVVWSEPCQTPSATLAKALKHLRVAVGLDAP